MEYSKAAQLLFLLDAESEGVRRAAIAELRDLGPALTSVVNDMAQDLPPERLFLLHNLIREQQEQAWNQSWQAWQTHTDPMVQLEAGMAFLANIIQPQDDRDLGRQLDDMAADFLHQETDCHAMSLAQFLFQEGRLKGNHEAYYVPANSNLRQVLDQGLGIPLTLAVAFILIGNRLDLNIQGFNLPGHFLARADLGRQVLIFDCFNAGKILNRQEVFALTQSPETNLAPLLRNPPSVETMITRGVQNLVNAYRRFGEIDKGLYLEKLIATLHPLPTPPPAPERPSREQATFRPGQLVKHHRYGYRGVVVDVDPTCQADDAWYFRNATQPKREQPWYHVLVDGSQFTTYAAESSLTADVSGQVVHHPLIGVYFTEFRDGYYDRNDVPWAHP